MSDLTVLVSPTPLYPRQSSLGFNFARRSENDLTRPVMVTLESVDAEEDVPHSPVEVSNVNAAFLSPPRRTFKASRSPLQRPASAPPLAALPAFSESFNTPPIADVPRRVFSSSAPTHRSELSRPPPPLFRPTTFWRRTKRSGVAGASYSPSSHLIRRSTFIAAGLSLDRPEADLSALGVESRQGSMMYIQSTGTRSTIPPNRFTYIHHPNIVNPYRINQAVPSAPSASYDGRWPYYAAGDTPTLTSLLTDPLDADADEATTTQDVVLSSDLPTTSLIQVTALPPATTSPQAILPKLPYHRTLNVLYLIPLFVALGVAFGAITAVILLKWRGNSRRLLRTSTLLPGPPYVPPENDIEERLLVHGYPSMEQVSLFAATPSKFTVHGSRYIPKRTVAWQTLDTTHPPYSQSVVAQTIIPSSDGERFTVVTEEDPFLATSLMIMQQLPEPSNDVSLPNIGISPSIPDPASGEKSGSVKSQHANFPKPFRRSMFDILKLKGPYRPLPGARKGHTDPTLHDEPADGTPTNPVHRVSNLKTTLASQRHSRSARRSLNGGSCSDTEDVPGLLVPQDEKHDLADALAVLSKQIHRRKEDILQGEKMKKPRKVTPFAADSPGLPKVTACSEDRSPNTRDEVDRGEHSDIYTKAPQRRRSRSLHKKLSTGDVSTRSSAPDMHVSILPLSPPSLMSPPLEKSLFFTSSLSLSTSLASHMNTLAAGRSPSLHYVDKSPEFSLFPLPSHKTKPKKKLRTSRPAPPLPHPSFPDLVHVQSPPREHSSSTHTKQQSVSPGSPRPKSRSTSVVHRETTTGIYSLGSLSPTSLAAALASSSSSDMLSKVNDIVALGYTRKRRSMGGASDKIAPSWPDSV